MSETMTAIDVAKKMGGFPESFTSREFCKAVAQTGNSIVTDYFQNEWAASLAEVQTMGTKKMADAVANWLWLNSGSNILKETAAILSEMKGDKPAPVEPPVDVEPAPEVPLQPAVVPTTELPVDPAAQMMLLFQQMMGQGGAKGLTDEEKAELVVNITGATRENLLKEFGPGGGHPTKIVIVDKDDTPIPGQPGEGILAHSITELACISAFPGCNTALTGPAGSGKTHLAGMMAKARGIKFVPVSCNPMMTPGQLIGAKGLKGFDESVLIKACREATLLLLDEFDNMRGDLASICNSVLANRTITIPHTGEVVECHPDTVFVVAMNTFGTGATDLYQRQRMDAATMDRFFFLEMKYDPGLEAAMSGCELKIKSPDYSPLKGGKLESKEAWFHYIQAVRKSCDKHGIKHVVSPRATKAGIELAEKGVGVHWLKEGLVFKGLKPQHRDAIIEDCKECKLVA